MLQKDRYVSEWADYTRHSGRDTSGEMNLAETTPDTDLSYAIIVSGYYPSSCFYLKRATFR
jgi:hypothetical protein